MEALDSTGGKSHARHVLPVKLVVRESAGPARSMPNVPWKE